jgi:hypothetical protein
LGVSPITACSRAKTDQILGRQSGQHPGVDVVVAENLLVLSEPQAAQPFADIPRHRAVRDYRLRLGRSRAMVPAMPLAAFNIIETLSKTQPNRP